MTIRTGKRLEAFHDGKISPSRMSTVEVIDVVSITDMSKKYLRMWKKAIVDDFNDHLLDGIMCYVDGPQRLFDWNCDKFIFAKIVGDKETEASPYHNMCLKTHVSAVQCNDLETFTQILMYQGGFCKPLVDWKGNVHASESCLCQSFGNVNTELPGEIFDLIRAGRPCGKCIPCKRYLSEDDPKMVAARRLLGQ